MTARWWVVCPTYRAGPFQTPAHAQRMVDAITRLGACSYDHRIEEGK